MKDQYLLKYTAYIFHKLVVQESFIDGNFSGLIAMKINLIVFTNVINFLFANMKYIANSIDNSRLINIQ